MPKVLALLFETGLNQPLPGVQSDAPAATIPFWGSFHFFDFVLGNLSAVDQTSFVFVVDARNRDFVHYAHRRWDRLSIKSLVLEDGGDQLNDLIRKSNADVVIASNLSFVALFDGETLIKKALRSGVPQAARISIQSIPVDIFVGSRDRFLDVFGNADFERHVPDSPSDYVRHFFDGVIRQSFQAVCEVPGKVLFQESIWQFCTGNRWLVENIENSGHRILISRLDSARMLEKDSYIGSAAYVKDSVVSPGVEIDGYVEGSLIFSGCTVRRNSKIVDSVIMNNNCIGEAAEISNTVLFPYEHGSSRPEANIGERARLGGSSKYVRNRDFPKHIQGITVVGMNADIPAGFVAEPGCLIDSNVSRDQLRRLVSLRKGSSVFADSHGQ